MSAMRILLVFILLLGSGQTVQAADNNTSVASGATVDLSYFTGCKTFINTCGAAVMIPTAYQVTWDAIPFGFGTSQCVQQLTCFGGEPSGTNVAYNGNGGVVTVGGSGGTNAVLADGERYTKISALEVTFAASETINTINVYTVQDGYGTAAPTLAMTFTQYGITDFIVQYWDGAAWRNVPGGYISNNNKVWVQITFADITTTKIRVLVEGTLNTDAQITELEALRSSDATNVALASNGGSVVAYTTFPMRPASYAIDGSLIPDAWRSSVGAGPNRFWSSSGEAGPAWIANGTSSPQWVQVNFSGSETINRIAVYLHDDAPTTPLPTRRVGTQTVCTSGCVRDFKVQYWDGAAWQDISSMTYTGNTRAVRDETFSSISTSRIRVYMTLGSASSGDYRLSEIKAFRASDGRNVALAAYGGVASASSTTFAPAGVTPSRVIDGIDINASQWIQVAFDASYTINEVIVFNHEGNTGAIPVSRPTVNSFSIGGYTTDFEVQYWNGTGWLPISGATVTGNRLIKRHFKFSSLTTDKIRVVIYATNDGTTRISEIEAWTP